MKSSVYIEMRLLVAHSKNQNVEEVINAMDYTFNSNTHDAPIVDSRIIGINEINEDIEI